METVLRPCVPELPLFLAGHGPANLFCVCPRHGVFFMLGQDIMYVTHLGLRPQGYRLTFVNTVSVAGPMCYPISCGFVMSSAPSQGCCGCVWWLAAGCQALILVFRGPHFSAGPSMRSWTVDYAPLFENDEGSIFRGRKVLQ